MISVIAKNKGETNRYNSNARVMIRFFETFAPFICGIELIKGRPELARLWIDTDTDEIEGFMAMLTAFVNPWTGGNNTVEILKDDYEQYGYPSLTGNGRRA